VGEMPRENRNGISANAGASVAMQELLVAAQDVAVFLDELAWHEDITDAAENANRLWEAIDAVGRELGEGSLG
jgi:hypothetical protein